jgi:hypothetical protein
MLSGFMILVWGRIGPDPIGLGVRFLTPPAGDTPTGPRCPLERGLSRKTDCGCWSSVASVFMAEEVFVVSGLDLRCLFGVCLASSGVVC